MLVILCTASAKDQFKKVCRGREDGSVDKEDWVRTWVSTCVKPRPQQRMTMHVCNPRVRGSEADRPWEFPSQQVQKKTRERLQVHWETLSQEKIATEEDIQCPSLASACDRTRTHIWRTHILTFFTLQGFSPLLWWISSGFVLSVWVLHKNPPTLSLLRAQVCATTRWFLVFHCTLSWI